jgi:hypothetical protein
MFKIKSFNYIIRLDAVLQERCGEKFFPNFGSVLIFHAVSHRREPKVRHGGGGKKNRRVQPGNLHGVEAPGPRPGSVRTEKISRVSPGASVRNIMNCRVSGSD